MNTVKTPEYRAAALKEAVHFGYKCMERLSASNLQDSQFSGVPLNQEQTGGCVDPYDVSENLLFLLRLYKITTNAEFLKVPIEMVQRFKLEISEKRTHVNCLGIGAVCSALYNITGNKQYVDSALVAFRFDESAAICEYTPEQIIIRNLFTLLELFGASKNEAVLFKINLSIIKLLRNSYFGEGGIYWSFLHHLDAEFRQKEERMLQLIFFEMHRTFKNETFLYITNNMLTKPDRRRHSNRDRFPISESPVKKLRETTAELINISIESLIQLHKSFVAKEIDFQPRASRIIQAIKQKYRGRQNNAITNFGTLKDLIPSIVYFHAYRFTSEERYRYRFCEYFNRIVKFDNFDQDRDDDFFHRFGDVIFLNRELFNMLFTNEADLNPFLNHEKTLNHMETSCYPGIYLSKAELKQLILSNRFERSIQLLRDKLPQKWHRYLNNQKISKKDENIDFVQFARRTTQVNIKLKEHLGPILLLEEKAHRLMEKYQSKREISKNPTNLKNDLLSLNDADFACLMLNVHIDIEIVKIKWDPVLRLYAFTFKQYFASRGRDFVAIRYDPIKRCIDEFIVDKTTAITITTLKKEPSISSAIQKICSSIVHQKHEDLESIVVKLIKRLIEIDFLSIKELV